MFPTEEIITVNSKNYCSICGKQPAQDAKDYKTLTDYLWDVLGIRDWVNAPLITTYIKKIKEKYGLTNSQILYTLYYMYEYADNPAPKIETESDIFMVVRYFAESREFWQKYKEMRMTKSEFIEYILTKPPIAIDVARSEIIKKQEEDDEKRDKRNHKEEISADDIVDDGIVNTDFIGDCNFRKEFQKQKGKDTMYLSELQKDIQEIMSEHPEEWEV